MQSHLIRLSCPGAGESQRDFPGTINGTSPADAGEGTEVSPRPCSPTSPQFVRRVLAARAARRHFFNAELFSDPAWDILLELYALHCEQRRTSVSKLCIAAAVPATTALRWIEKLNADGLLTRHEDPLDGRRVWVSISERGAVAMAAYLEELSPAAMPL